MSIKSIKSIKSIQFFLKHLQQRAHYEIGANFDYSSIDEDDFLNFTHDPSNWLINGLYPRPFSTSSTPRKLLDSLESIEIEFEHSSLPFNGESTPSLCVIKGCNSSAFDSINVYIACKE